MVVVPVNRIETCRGAFEMELESFERHTKAKFFEPRRLSIAASSPVS
jgi:hypothetical protein